MHENAPAGGMPQGYCPFIIQHPTDQQHMCHLTANPIAQKQIPSHPPGLTSASTAIHDRMSAAVCSDLNAVSKGVPATAPVAAAASLNQSPPCFCRWPAVDSC